MDTTGSTEEGGPTARPSVAATGPPAAAGDPGRLARLGAGAVLLGTAVTTIGTSWDVQWHVDVGPDTFFTLPHLALYAGSAIAGIASLVIVLAATNAQRAGRPVDRTVGGTPIRVFGGVFSAPLGYLVSGVGAALFLIYGLLDLWWHAIYGFDATLISPPHVALFLSIAVAMVGSVIVFAAAREQVWGQVGLLAALTVMLTFSPMTTNAVGALSFLFDVAAAASVFCAVLCVILARLVIRRPGAAVGFALVMGAVQAFLWWFSPWAAHTYAAGVGLPLRDGLTPGPPELPGTMPMFLVVAALVVEALPWLVHRRGLDPRRAVLLVGGVCGLLVAIALPVQQALTDPTASTEGAELVVNVIVGTLAGVLGGFLSGRLAVMLHALAPPSPVAFAGDAAATTAAGVAR